jgi:threonine/homoserine/homoserine lactone efflux protein
MTIYAILSLAFAVLLLASSPGPGVFAVVARALSSGFRPALIVVAGIVLGDLVYLLFAILGLAFVAQMMGEFFSAIRIAGGLYLVWLGIRMWRSTPGAEDEQATARDETELEYFSGGLLITLSNPKVILFYCGLLPTFLDLTKLGTVDLVVAATVVSVVLGTVLAVYAWLASSARRMFSSQRAVKRLNRAAGGLMATAGAAIAARS